MKMHDLEILFVGAINEGCTGMTVKTIRHHLNFLLYGAEDVALKVWEIDYVKAQLPDSKSKGYTRKRRLGKFKMRPFDWESSLYCKVLQCTYVELSDGHVLDIQIGLN